MRDAAGRPALPRPLGAAVLVWALPAVLLAEEPIQVNPNRPTFASPALTTQIGVAELELGVQYTLPREGGDVAFTPFLLKLGLSKRFELRVGGGGLLRDAPSGALSATGFGDVTVGGQWTYLQGKIFGIDQALQLTVKIPTASSTEGLGTGRADETVAGLFSRDIGPYHADANILVTWLGETGRRESQGAATLSVSRTLSEEWSVTGELYWIGATTENETLVSNLWCVGRKISSRFVLDGGVDVGLSHGAQRVSLFAGFTYGLGRFLHPANSHNVASGNTPLGRRVVTR
jgi:outer membrane putative beta-barrel porin/alpha-amylase